MPARPPMGRGALRAHPLEAQVLTEGVALVALQEEGHPVDPQVPGSELQPAGDPSNGTVKSKSKKNEIKTQENIFSLGLEPKPLRDGQ